MKKNIFLTVVLVAVFVGSCIAAAMPEFSADMVSTTKGKAVQAKVYFTANKYRTESNKSVSIVRIDKNVVWTIMPGQKTYMEMKLNEKNKLGTGEKMPGEYSRVKIGKETVNGISCIKYKISYKVKGKTSESYQWISGDGIPVKTAAVDGSWTTEYKNIKRGKINPSLFEVPKGYKKLSLPAF